MHYNFRYLAVGGSYPWSPCAHAFRDTIRDVMRSLRGGVRVSRSWGRS